MQDEAEVSREFLGLSLNQQNASVDMAEPPPPKITSEGVVSTDITAKFIAASKALAPGELVKDGYFTLFESVGALEIMDPKMDSGCLAPGETLDEEYDVTRPLLPAEVLGIIDQLLCHEVAWHLGYPLSQTLLTNVYIDSILWPTPASVDDAHFVRDLDSPARGDPMLSVLRAYCVGMLKACWYVNERIKFEHYYEEEDFVTNTYHRSLLDNIDRERVRDIIQDARTLVQSLSHRITEEMARALDFRLELRYAFLRAIELSELRSNSESLKTPWIQLQVVLEQVNKTHALGVPVPEAFSTKLQRRLASTMPPRPIVHLSFEDTYGHLKKLFVDGVEVTEVLKYKDSQSLLNFVLAFQAKKPQPLVYIRTLLQNYLFKDMVLLGSLSIRQVFDDDLSIVSMPCSRLLDRTNDAVEAVHDPRFAMAHQMEIFRQRAAQSYLDIFRAFCQNRCRVRRTLCHTIQDWETVQVDAEEIDQLLQVQLEEKPMVSQGGGGGGAGRGGEPAYSLPLSSWAYLYKIRLMEWIVQLGFELEVYQPDELAGMYWYLAYLAKTRAQHTERIKAFTVRSLNEHRANPKTFTAAQEAQFTRSLSYLRATMLDAAVTWELADALSGLYTALGRAGLIAAPARPYGADRLRYELRMRPFAPVGLPELPSFEAFAAAAEQPAVPTAAVLDLAERAVAGAKKGYEVLARFSEAEAFTANTHERWLAGTKSCLKSVILAGIAVSTLKALLAQAGDGEVRATAEVPPPGACYHEWWIVPKIVRSA